MAAKSLAAAIVVGCVIYVAPSAQEPPAAAPGYAWAGACKTCHEPIYKAWEKTKHATALQRLSAEDQQKECIGCHVTGPKKPLMEGTKVVNAGIQCEGCHGPAAAHAADPNVRTGLVKKPQTEKCEECHSPKSPKFKGFWYGAMAGLVHKP